MRAANEIITKKDYSQRKSSSWLDKDSPFWMKLLSIMFVALLTFAGLGEWKTLNNALGGLPKIITAGIIAATALYAIIYPDIKRLRSLRSPTLLYMSLMIALLVWSMVIWIMDFATFSSVTRGFSKLMFQSISILTAIAGVYLFGSRAVDLFALAMCMANGAIMVLEIPKFGLAASIQSLITCFVTFGDAEGYARQLEIHDLTFVFGQLVLYYAAFAPTGTAQEKKRRWFFLLASFFFFLVGMKRIAIPAVMLFTCFAFLFRNRKHLKPLMLIIGFSFVAFFLLFIYAVKMGYASKLLNSVGIDMMGREYLWSLAGDYYDFSITYMGHGFEFVDSIVALWYNSGIINHPYPFHNDILKVFVELGFPGFLIWSVQQYIVSPLFFLKYADDKTALLYISELGYMTMTYLTDNTAFYFWSTMALRIIVLSFAIARHKPKEKQTWQPPTKAEIREHIRIAMQD